MFTGSLLMLSFILLGCATTGPDGPSQTASQELPKGGEVLRMGFIGPLTGDAASLGQDQKAMVEMWAEQHTIAGKRVEIVYEDGKCNGQEAASAAQKLIAINQVQVILGGLCSGETLGAATIAEANQVILFSSASTSPEITTAGEYIFRNAPSDKKSSAFLSELIAKKYKAAALISQNNDYASAYRGNLLHDLPAAGVEIVVDEAFNSGVTDFKTIFQKVKNSTADVLILIPGETSPGGFLVKQALELGLELPTYGGDILAGKEFFEIGKDATEGVKMVIMTADESNQQVKEFTDNFQTSKGREPNALIYLLLGWDALNILKQAIETVGYDGTEIKEYLYSMSAYDGLGGQTKFDSNGDVALNPSLMVVRNGKFVPWNDADEEVMMEEKMNK